YGQAKGETEMTDYELVAPASAEKPGKAKALRTYKLTPGTAYLYNEGDLHSPRRNGPTQLIRLEGTNMDRVQRLRFEAGSCSASRLHDPHVALGALAERLERRLIARAVVRGDGLRHAFPFGDHGALAEAMLVGLGGIAAHEEPTAGRLDRRPGKLGVGGERLGVGNGAIAGDPVSLGHGASPRG